MQLINHCFVETCFAYATYRFVQFEEKIRFNENNKRKKIQEKQAACLSSK